MSALTIRSGELVELAQRFGYFPPEPVAAPKTPLPGAPFSGHRSILTACILSAMGRRNARAQVDALVATTFALGADAESPTRLDEIAQAESNLREAANWWCCA